MVSKGFFAKAPVKYLKLFWFFSFVVFLYYCNLFGLSWLVRLDRAYTAVWAFFLKFRYNE